MAWKRVKFDEMFDVLAGCHPDYQQPFLKCNWIQDRCGFRMAKGVVANCGGKKNPRISGKMELMITKDFKSKYMASEGLQCNGSTQCTLTNNVCQVRLKLCYLHSREVDIFIKCSDHGPNFVGGPQKITHATRSHVRAEDDRQRSLGRVGVTPFSMYLEFSKEKEKNPQIILPSKKEIENILFHHRRGIESDPLADLDNFIKNSKSVIYPTEMNDFPSRCYGVKPSAIILKAREETINEFMKCSTKNNFFIWGMDSQYCNNNARLPITILCCQTEARKTIPAFVALTFKSDEAHYSIIIQQVLLHLKNYYNFNLSGKLGYIMIDKDAAERNAIKKNNLNFLLCQFHIMRTITNKINKSFKEKESRKECE